MSVLNKKVLVLTRDWRALTFTTVRNALHRMAKPRKDDQYVVALRYDEESGYVPVEWEEWIQLPVAPDELAVTTPKIRIKIPTIIISKRVRKIPYVTPKLNKETLWFRQGGKDMYSLQPLEWEDCNIDHYVPRKHGGRTSFTNCGLTTISNNQKKGHLRAEEVGLVLSQPLTAPPTVPISFRLRKDPKHPEWDAFLH